MTTTRRQHRDRTPCAGDTQQATRCVPLYQSQTVARAIEPATIAYPARLLEALRAAGQPAASTNRPAARDQLRRRTIAAATALAVAATSVLAWLVPYARDHGADTRRTRAGQPQPATPAARAGAPVGFAHATAAETPRELPEPRGAPRPSGMRDAARAPPTPRAAAEHLARGRYAEALDAYRRLSQSRPELRVYAEIAAIIERRLALRCERRAEPDEAACADAGR